MKINLKDKKSEELRCALCKDAMAYEEGVIADDEKSRVYKAIVHLACALEFGIQISVSKDVSVVIESVYLDISKNDSTVPDIFIIEFKLLGTGPVNVGFLCRNLKASVHSPSSGILEKGIIKGIAADNGNTSYSVKWDASQDGFKFASERKNIKAFDISAVVSNHKPKIKSRRRPLPPPPLPPLPPPRRFPRISPERIRPELKPKKPKKPKEKNIFKKTIEKAERAIKNRDKEFDVHIFFITLLAFLMLLFFFS